MNYFSHGFRYIDRPYFLAGTAVPDWIRVSDQGVRVRSKHVAEFASGDSSIRAELAAGILQHLDDDDTFHSNGRFMQICAQISILFREGLAGDQGQRPSFLGHIAIELILDAILIDRFPNRLLAYYEALLQIDPQLLQLHLNEMVRDPAVRLAEFIPLFHREQFLWDYRDSNGMRTRLNQVLRRVKLPPMPPETVKLLDSARIIVERNFTSLLPFQP
ncbi:MAG: hypothetical protein JWM11_1534 [Planctomycetaceae bacterium]|nr:hypothetical protein [Planctomycetaceae bacterium]